MASVLAKGKGKASEVEKVKDKDKANWDTKAHDIWVDVFVAEETGLGWDSERQTVAADDEWWEKKIQMNPEVAKFRIKGLDHCHKLDEIYRPVTATGARAWAPTSGELPLMYENCPTENDGDAGSDESKGDDLRGNNGVPSLLVFLMH
ncbi:hypothetical protein L1049_013266 [Liquidambar formosana]|uniref:Myb/SANT-like domain-containing protein n=1 Tax=Liquidambar formosana TaxID=63359 RepID=A0AAP0RNB0_LIQFO